MHLITDMTSLQFQAVQLHFQDRGHTNVFAKNNNKTVAQTMQEPRYTHLAGTLQRDYGKALEQPLGDFLLHLKTQKDPFYLNFLNKYGDATYCTFAIYDAEVIRQRGLYIFAVGKEVQYIGKTNATFGKRINQGYGRIHPKNCYLDGQATNCHLNMLITQHHSAVTFYIAPLNEPVIIGELERYFIQAKLPPWNIALKALPK